MAAPDPIEIWKPVVGFEGVYEVSSRGRVKRLAGTVPGLRHDRLLRPLPRKGNYPSVKLSKGVARADADGRSRQYLHRLVAAAFIGPCPAGCQVNHRDGDKDNPRAENLEYVTGGENQRHRYETLGHQGCRAALTPEQVRCVRRALAKRGGYGHGKRLAVLLGVSHKTISAIRRGTTYAHVK